MNDCDHPEVHHSQLSLEARTTNTRLISSKGSIIVHKMSLLSIPLAFHSHSPPVHPPLSVLSPTLPVSLPLLPLLPLSHMQYYVLLYIEG